MLSRREFIVTTGIGGSTLLAGCTENSQSSASDDLEPPLLGDPESSIVVDVYADYQCSHCADFKRNSYPILKDEYIDTGVIAYRHREVSKTHLETTSSGNSQLRCSRIKINYHQTGGETQYLNLAEMVHQS